jgi:eukaryotic-like serine/threonine-protein kinase
MYLAMKANSARSIEIFTEAIQVPAEDRSAFLDRACAGNEALRKTIETLLKSHDRSGGFLEEPAYATIDDYKPKELPGERIGDWVDRYKLIQQIGEGGCGIVFMAEQEKPVRRRVAVKIIKPGMDTKSVIARFEAERQVLALMDHPYIAHVLDAGSTRSGRPYFVMELVEGVKITDYCDRHSLPTESRLALFIQVCEAIQYAHQKGIIHRDIKPSNILVTTDLDGRPSPKIIDFGIAKATSSQQLTEKTIFTTREMLMGTPAYMSPEQAAFSSAEMDTRTDIYSLGVLLYELLTGTTPFDAHELLKVGFDEVRRVIREVEPVRPSARLNSLSKADLLALCRHRDEQPSVLLRPLRGDLDWIVMKSLEKDRSHRYETATGLLKDVQRFLAQEPVSARPPSKLYMLQKVVLRNKLLFSGVGVILFLLVTGLVAVSTAFALERRARHEAETASLESQQVTKFLEDALRGVAPSVALGEDTTMLRGILDRTSMTVSEEMTNQPIVEAEIEDLVGTLYRQIGNYSRAEEMHRSALAIRRKFLGSDDPRVAESLNELGYELQAEKKTAEAESAFKEALTIRQQLFGLTNAATATSINDLSTVYRDEGRLNEAEAMAGEALGIRQYLFGQTNLDVADSLRNMSMILGNQGKWAESEATTRKVLAIRQQLLGPEHPWIASALGDLAWAEDGQGKTKEAEALQREAFAMRQRLLPAEDPDIAQSLRLVGDSMRKNGDLNNAYLILNAALSIQCKVLSEDDPASIDTLHDLGLTLEGEQKWPEAETINRKVLDLWRKHSGNESQQTLFAMSDLESALEKENKWPEVETLDDDSLKLSRKILGAEDPHTLYLMHCLALAFEKEGKWSDAESMHREALDLHCKRSGKESTEAISAMINLAETLEGEGKWSQAEDVLSNASASCQKMHGNGGEDILYTLWLLDTKLQGEGKWSEDEFVVRKELELRQKIEGDTAADTLHTMYTLGYALENEHKRPEAEDVYRSAIALWRKINRVDDPQTLSAVKNLAETLQNDGKLLEAENLERQEIESLRQLNGNDDEEAAYLRGKLGSVLEAEGKWPESETVFRESFSLSSNKGDHNQEAMENLEHLLRALLPQKKYGDAKILLDKVLTPEFVKDPASADLLTERVNLMGRQGRWSDAIADAGLLLQLEPSEPYHYHRLAALYAISQDQLSYKQLCKKMVMTFTNMANPYVDERVADDCLLLPNADLDLGSADKYADQAVTLGSNETDVTYFQACKAMSDYRLGRYVEAIEWANKAANSSTAEVHARAKAFAVLAMADWQLGDKDAARASLIEGDALTPRISSLSGKVDLGGSWVAWLMARISLDEATTMLNSGSIAARKSDGP